MHCLLGAIEASRRRMIMARTRCDGGYGWLKSMTGRTSMLPTRADGIFDAT